MLEKIPVPLMCPTSTNPITSLLWTVHTGLFLVTFRNFNIIKFTNTTALSEVFDDIHQVVIIGVIGNME